MYIHFYIRYFIVVCWTIGIESYKTFVGEIFVDIIIPTLMSAPKLLNILDSFEKCFALNNLPFVISSTYVRRSMYADF